MHFLRMRFLLVLVPFMACGMLQAQATDPPDLLEIRKELLGEWVREGHPENRLVFTPAGEMKLYFGSRLEKK